MTPSLDPNAIVIPPEAADLPDQTLPESPDTNPPENQDPEPDDMEKALVKDLTEWATETREFWSPIRDRIAEELEFVAGNQWPDQKADDDRYVANVTRRLINAKVSGIYAKNPRAVSKVRPKQDFVLWDGDPASIEMAKLAVNDPVTVQAADVGDPQAMELLMQSQAIIADFENGMSHREMVKRWGRSLELVYDHQCDQQAPRFKASMKSLVRRALSARVGWVVLNYRRAGETVNTSTPQANTPERVKTIAQKLSEIAENETDSEADKAKQEVELMNQSLADGIARGEEKLVDEGLVFDFPAATSILVDKSTTNLRTLSGAKRVAREFLLCPDEVERRYGVSVQNKATPYAENGTANETWRNRPHDAAWPDDSKVCVWEIYDIQTQLRYTVCDGYDAFLEEPEKPSPCLSRFWPIFALTFNDIEVEQNCPDKDVTCYPPSDVRLLMHMQRELNRSREALRQHRIANRVLYRGHNLLSEKDRNTLASGHPDNYVIVPEGPIPAGEKLIETVQKAPLDQAVYMTQHVEMDILSTVGAQQANLGPTSDATATEVSVAEGSRIQQGSSDVDDLNDCLTELYRGGGEMLLQAMPQEQVKLVCGPGAAWPQSPGEIYNSELFLEAEADSSGRPNRALEMSVLRELVPLLMQLPNLNVDALLRRILRVWDDSIDLEEFYQKGAPSVITQNRSQSPQQVAAGAGAPGQASDGNQTAPGERPQNANNPEKSAAEQSPTTAGMPTKFQNKTAQSASQPR